jgi:hypothetical protein
MSLFAYDCEVFSRRFCDVMLYCSWNFHWLTPWWLPCHFAQSFTMFHDGSLWHMPRLSMTAWNSSDALLWALVGSALGKEYAIIHECIATATQISILTVLIKHSEWWVYSRSKDIDDLSIQESGQIEPNSFWSLSATRGHQNIDLKHYVTCQQKFDILFLPPHHNHNTMPSHGRSLCIQRA